MEKFAVDLDAVLDEFELNEDQAEVAAARLQKQIEQGRLEIASSDTTPGSSYANSPRSSFAHLHEEPGRTVSPLARPASSIEPAAAAAAGSLTVTSHKAPADLPTNHRLPADLAANHDQPPALSTNHYTTPAYPAASELLPYAVAAGPGRAPYSSSSSDTGSPEHYPGSPGPVNGDTKPLTSPDSVLNSAPAPPGSGLAGPTSNGEGPASHQLPATSLVSEQSSVGPSSEGLGSTGQSEKAPAAVLPVEDLKTHVVAAEGLKTPVVAAEGLKTHVIAAEGLKTPVVAAEGLKTPVVAAEGLKTHVIAAEGLKTELPSAEEAVPPPVVPEPPSSVTVQTPPPESSPRPAAAVIRDAVVAPEHPETGKSVPDGGLLTLPADVVSRDPPAGPDCGAGAEEQADPVDRQSAPGDGCGSGTNPASDDPAQKMETPAMEPSPAAAPPAPAVTGSALEADNPAVEERTATPSAADPPTPSATGLSSLLAQVATAPSPPTTPPTAAAESPVGPNPAAAVATPTAVMELAVTEPDRVTEPEPQPEPEPEPELKPEPEPVRFQPADDVSDSELETYLEQLEDDDAGAAPSGPPADESFGGARPKTMPMAAAATAAAAPVAAVEPLPPPPAVAQPPPEPAGAALQPLKGGVISRLQSQVSIECEVDSRSSRAAAAETGRGSPPPPSPTAAPVRPSSLDLPSRSQSIAEQPEPQPTDDTASEPAADAVSSPDAAEPPPPAASADDDDAASEQESVSTTGGNIVTAPGAYEEARLAAGLAPSAPPAATSAATRGQLVSLSDEDKNLGKVAPVWVPDEDAVACMECELKFTVIRRRHHCRACGRLLCSACCSERMCLDYMEFREGRVCTRCKRTIDRVQQESRVVSAGGAAASQHQMARPPNPNNPMEYCSTVPPTQQASHNALPPTVMVPTGVLKRSENSGGRTPSREAKQVMFSDGIRPGGDLTEPDRPPGQRAAGADTTELRRPPHRRTARLARGSDRSPAAILKDAKGCKDLSWKPESGKLPPIYQSGSAGASVKQSTPEETIVSMIRAERDLPWSFLINKNLMVVVKMFKLDCCVGRTCWIFTSHGLSTVGQEEVVVILESLPDEATLPKDIFFFYHHLFAEAAKGHFVTELGNTLFSAPFLGSKDHGGFLYLRPTFQCLHNVPTPPQPFLVAVLIQKWEAPWAKVFPLRLLLRLGAEFRYYPCPLVSVRHRKPVFFEVGHTIINLLADFRNFAYVLPTVHGMHIHMEEQETSVLIPRNRFNQVLKAINNSNDHVLALGASFSREADSHLVCMQNEDGQYQTQAINIQNRPRQVTGASFVVFNGALKSAAGVTAKSSIVEDGLMFQISSDTMQTLRGNLRQMQDYKIECGPVGQPPDEVINIKWVEDDRSHNLGVRSVIDDKPLDGIPSIRVHSGTDYVGDSKLIRWTEVYLIKVTESVARSSSEPPDFSRLAEEVARGTCVALTPHLPLLADSERTRIGLRATVDRDTVGYEAGSNGEPLPPSCMNLLDSELVPVLHRYAAEVPDSPSCLELLFHVIDR